MPDVQWSGSAIAGQDDGFIHIDFLVENEAPQGDRENKKAAHAAAPD